MSRTLVVADYSIFDRLIEGVQVIDSDFRYVYVNQAVAEHGRTTVGALIGRTMSECYPGIEQTEIYRLIGLCAADRTYRSLVNEFQFADGSAGYFELRVQAVPEGVLVMSFDVTAQVRARRALEEMNAELERRVEERTAQLVAKNQELAEVVYMASHDLLGPLRTIAGHLDILREDVRDALPAEGRAPIDFIAQAAGRMQELVYDVIAYARLDTPGARTRVDLDALAHRALEGLSSLVAQTGANVEIARLPEVDGHAPELQILFTNLLSNAIKFHKHGVAPTVRVTATREGAAWEFSVADDGIGFDMAHGDRVFAMFQRLHPRTAYDGTGIGLTLCRKVVALHGGEIWAESERNRGTTISFSLPDRASDDSNGSADSAGRVEGAEGDDGERDVDVE